MKNLHNAYETLMEQNLDVIHARGYLLRHKKTGATLALVSNDDYNKVFYVGFRTPPEDSTGVAHIVEHTVLCGSDKYPLKDPFVELVKGSMNTFINAMTYPDKTVYPVASTNDKDFHNLMDVYMDAVFNPNIYKYPEIFKQEGWHYEMTEPDGDITLNGVVYNEMKGAFSSPDDVLNRYIMNSLFPDTTYAMESGGDPDVIPTLTREKYLEFHKKFYHPSNSYIYLYGDMDMAERLDYLDREYLSKYDSLDVNSEIKKQEKFDEPVLYTKKYSINSDDDPAGKAYLSMNFVIGDYEDSELVTAFNILDYALLSAPGAPVNRALRDAGIGEDITGGFEAGTIHPVFSIIAKNTDLDRKEEFEKVVREALEKVVKEGFDREVLLAGIESNKFRFLESDFGSFPKGLIYGLDMLDTWLYDKNRPFDTFNTVKLLDKLKDEHLEDGYFEKLVQEYLLDNKHQSFVIVEPEPGLTNKRDEELKEELNKYKATLSEQEKKDLIEDTKALKKYQEEPTPDEVLQKIPMLERKDLRREIRPLGGKEHIIDGLHIFHNDIETNGIQYYGIHFFPRGLTVEDVPAVSLYTKILGLVDTERYSYGELATKVNVYTGGVSTDTRIIGRRDDTSAMSVCIKTKTFLENSEKGFDIMMEILFHSKFDDKKRIREIVLQEKAQMEGYLMSAGHAAAAMRAGSYFSGAALLGDHATGLSYFRFLQEFEKDFDKAYDKLIRVIEKLRVCMFNTDSIYINNIGREASLQQGITYIPRLKQEISDYVAKASGDTVSSYKKETEQILNSPDFEGELSAGRIFGSYPGEFEGKRPVNEGFKTAGQVQYVCRAGNYHRNGYEFDGVMRMLKIILGYDYLWINVRVKGGAYGCMSGFSRAGDMHLVSYRDPNLSETVDIFNNTPEYLKNFDPDERTMTKYVIGTISAVDTPMTPSQEGRRNFTAYMLNYRPEVLQRERDRVLDCKPEDIRQIAKLVSDTLEQGYICAIGNEDKLTENSKFFNTIENLI